MWVGIGAGAWNAAADIKGSVSYVTLNTPSSSLVNTYNGAGVAVIDCVAGPYTSGGVSQLDANAWAANAVATYRPSASILAIEVLNEPGGTWFWGSNALSQANASAYANLLKTVHNAFVSAFGANRRLFLASYDGGYSGGLTWGQMVWAADPNVASYIDGITVHPYGGSRTRPRGRTRSCWRLVVERSTLPRWYESMAVVIPLRRDDNKQQRAW